MAARCVTKIGTPRLQVEGGGFLVRRAIGSVIPSCDPFIMLDHFGPMETHPGEAVGAPDHPHRGFETVTYIISGSSQHRDSVGNQDGISVMSLESISEGLLKDGWVQWMTAGSGVVHSEMPSEEMMENGGISEGFQLWVNLPAKDKMIPPRYQNVPPEKMPLVSTEDKQATVKIIAGEALGASSPIETKTPILYLDICVSCGGEYTHVIPNGYSGFAYVWRGAGVLGCNNMPAHMGQVCVISENGSTFTIKAPVEDCHVLLIAGEPIREAIVKHGPFVMNTRAEIDQAIDDYRSGKLGAIPGKEQRLQQTEQARMKRESNSREDFKIILSSPSPQ